MYFFTPHVPRGKVSGRLSDVSWNCNSKVDLCCSIFIDVAPFNYCVK